MLATLVIGLREGLEAALVVGIIAAFLRRAGRPLTAMWVGVGLAVAVSFLIGGGLLAVEAALPQAAQEGMESVIGLLAVVFVTAMLLWMNRHARSAKQELEAAASRALGAGTAWALAGMAFLAVLKEGFETSVFLIATFRAAIDPASAALGAVLGLVAAIVVGIGISTGGVRLDLRRFYRWTSPFLILLAAGLLLTSVRKAHGAGWIDAGQQPTVDLTWLAPRGSVQGALVTGVLGVPPDPRLVEVVAWVAYVVPTTAAVFWPARHRPRGRTAVRLRWASAALLVAGAASLVVVVPASGASAPAELPLASGGTASIAGGALVMRRTGAVTRVVLPGDGATGTQDGVGTRTWTTSSTAHPALASTITLARITELAGRVPVGLNAATNPGPFDARWTVTERTTATATDGGALLDASRTAAVLLTVSGGGLTASRTITVPASAAPAAQQWRVAPAAAARARAAVADAALRAPDHRLWGVQLPLLLLLAGALVAFGPTLRARLARRAAPTSIERMTPDVAS